MADRFPLLVFPEPRPANPKPGPRFQPKNLHFPSHTQQAERLNAQLDKLQKDFSLYKALLSESVSGLEPETVLVIETIGRVEDFKQAIDKTDGLEWLGEWVIEEIEPDVDFYEIPKIGVDFFKKKINITREKSKEIKKALEQCEIIDDKGNLITEDLSKLSLPADLAFLGNDIVDAITNAQKDKSLDGRLFLSMVNQQGMNELLSLWKKQEQERQVPAKWRDVFKCLKNIRRWGIKETLIETGMKEYFENFLDNQTASFQVECFYHQNEAKRRRVESNINQLISDSGGELLSPFIDMPDIAFHAVKARLPVAQIKALLEKTEKETENPHLFIYPNVMYFRQTGQNIISTAEGDGEEAEYPQTEAEQPPVAAILDGAPNLQHNALENLIDFDDPFNLTEKYLPGERRHGTAMASLVIHGDRSDETTSPILSKVHHVVITQPNEQRRYLGEKDEHFPEDCFFEDRIEQAVRRILEGDGQVEALAPTVKIVNLSLGDPTRLFIHTPSPWARLLDWLSWKYRVLFCVSAGNYTGNYNFGIPYSEYLGNSDEEKKHLLLQAIQNGLSERRLLGPAESINALTVGALHQDESGDNYHLGQRVDLLPDNNLLSPISRLGHGFRRSVKPEIYFPGGQQLYSKPLLLTDSNFGIDNATREPGQKVAYDSDQQGELSRYVFSRGTSNATALATRTGVLIHESLSQLNTENQRRIPDDSMAVLIKTLLVHGGVQNREAQQALINLNNQSNTRKSKTDLARYLGYGTVDIARALGCTEQRGTVIGFSEIGTDEIHEYRFPVPEEFGWQKTFRRMVVTLAWFSPINPRHRYLREAKLEIQPDENWASTPLKLNRTDSDHHQVKRGTVQHEIIEGKNQLAAFQQDEEIVLQITCKKDATENLEESIPYGLAVTLEAAEESGIPVYEKIRERITTQIEVSAI